jgi:hypothetical protein
VLEITSPAHLLPSFHPRLQRQRGEKLTTGATPTGKIKLATGLTQIVVAQKLLSGEKRLCAKIAVHRVADAEILPGLQFVVLGETMPHFAIWALAVRVNAYSMLHSLLPPKELDEVGSETLATGVTVFGGVVMECAVVFFAVFVIPGCSQNLVTSLRAVSAVRSGIKHSVNGRYKLTGTQHRKQVLWK